MRWKIPDVFDIDTSYSACCIQYCVLWLGRYKVREYKNSKQNLWYVHMVIISYVISWRAEMDKRQKKRGPDSGSAVLL